MPGVHSYFEIHSKRPLKAKKKLKTKPSLIAAVVYKQSARHPTYMFTKNALPKERTMITKFLSAFTSDVEEAEHEFKKHFEVVCVFDQEQQQEQ